VFACALQVPLLWNRSPEAAAAKLSSVASALGVAVPAAAVLYMAVPALAAINMPGVVRDRVDGLSDALGVTVAQVGLGCRLCSVGLVLGVGVIGGGGGGGCEGHGGWLSNAPVCGVWGVWARVQLFVWVGEL
jgi:hypothetical protein